MSFRLTKNKKNMEYIALAVSIISTLSLAVCYMKLYRRERRTNRALKITQSLKAKQKHEFDEFSKFMTHRLENAENARNTHYENYKKLNEQLTDADRLIKELTADVRAKEFEITRLETITQNADEELADTIKNSGYAV